MSMQELLRFRRMDALDFGYFYHRDFSYCAVVVPDYFTSHAISGQRNLLGRHEFMFKQVLPNWHLQRLTADRIFEKKEEVILPNFNGLILCTTLASGGLGLFGSIYPISTTRPSCIAFQCCRGLWL